MRLSFRSAAGVLVLGCALTGSLYAQSPAPALPPASQSGALANREFVVTSAQGIGIARYLGSGSLDGSPRVTRAIIIVHGVLRNADYYYETGRRAIARARAANALLIAPQFVEKDDLQGKSVSANTLRWNSDWPGGSDATAPVPISTYAVFDAMIQRLSDRRRFPALREIIIVGHSAGGQIVQRYAVVGRGPDLLARSPIAVHLIVANPSSYFFFDDQRPFPHDNCPDFNQWRYGFAGAPHYVTGTAQALEQRYVSRHVTYLLGTADTDPHEEDLDTSCGGEAQGPFRFARGKAYIRYIQDRHPRGTHHDYAFVRDVPHDNRRMFTSSCGVAVIFNRNRSACAATGTI